MANIKQLLTGMILQEGDICYVPNQVTCLVLEAWQVEGAVSGTRWLDFVLDG